MNTSSMTLKIGDFARKYVYRVNLEDSLENVIDLMVSKNIRHIPVIDNSKIMGIILINDVLDILSKQYDKTVLNMKVETFLYRDITILEKDVDMMNAIKTLADIDIDALLIVNKDQITGIYTEMDILDTDFLWHNISDMSVHSKKDFGDEITDFNCVSEDSSLIEAITLLCRLNTNYIGVIEPDSKILKGTLSSIGILIYIFNELRNLPDKYGLFKQEPVYKLNLEPVIYFSEPSSLNKLRQDLYFNDCFISTMLDDRGYPIRMVSVDHITQHFMENYNTNPK